MLRFALDCVADGDSVDVSEVGPPRCLLFPRFARPNPPNMRRGTQYEALAARFGDPPRLLRAARDSLCPGGRPAPWYHGRMPRGEAEAALAEEGPGASTCARPRCVPVLTAGVGGPGAFLVRASPRQVPLLCVSYVKAGDSGVAFRHALLHPLREVRRSRSLVSHRSP